jgi:thymidylate synthase (FAD)
MEATYITHMGDDLLVANAARVSFKKYRDKMDNGNINLIDFLEEKDHWSPFSHPQLCVHVKAPIFVARQLAKHQVGFAWNEVSRRYVDDPPEFFVPDMWRKRSKNKKQGSEDEPITDPLYNNMCDTIRVSVNEAYTEFLNDVIILYDDMIEHGVAPEQARMVLPQALYTEWYWTGSLAAWGRMACLRLKEDTQKETQYIARLISGILNEKFPISWPILLRGVEK